MLKTWPCVISLIALLSPCVLADSVVVFNEIMYHPRSETEAEWIELHNQMGVDIDLSGWSLQEGVDFLFPEGTFIHAGSYLVVTSDVSALARQMPAGVPLLGPFRGKLSNGGERLLLVNNSGRLLNQLDYDDQGDWPAGPDGSGVSLAKRDENTATEVPANWTWSERAGGTPGAPNFAQEADPPRTVRFNEMAAAGTDLFFVELINMGDGPVVPGSISLELQGQAQADPIVFKAPFASHDCLALNAAELGLTPMLGERMLLWSGDGRLLDAVTVESRLRGRHPDGTGDWLYPSEPTPGKANQFLIHRDIVINEIMYHPLTVPGVSGPAVTLTLIPEVTPARAWVPTDDALGTRWTGADEPFADEGWMGTPDGTTGVGYEKGTGYESYLGIDVGGDMDGHQASIYIRIPFQMAAVPVFDELLLQMRYDDGFIAYLNGIEVARANAPVETAWNSSATGSHLDSEAVTFQNFDITSFQTALRRGDNVLAIQGLNTSTTSSDFLIQPRLVAVLPPEAAHAETDPEDAQTWVELHHTGASPMDLSGWSFAAGIDYVFPPDTRMEPGEYLVVASDTAHLRQQYPDIRILGDFRGRLSHNGEILRLLDATGNPVDEVRYYEGGDWPEYPDAGGASLELMDPRADNRYGTAWAASDERSNTQWHSYRYRTVLQGSPVGNDALYSEFVMGLLYAGEILIDDLELIEDPDGAAVSLLQNGDFTPDRDKWRLIGNHSSSAVLPDPEEATNPVLHLVATGPTEHMSNHAETTLANGYRVTTGRTYEIRFRARWVAGCPLLHTRLFFNRAPHVTQLRVPERVGTPGRVNSRYHANTGPCFSDLSHAPAVPLPDEPVTVTVRATDPDAVAGLTLWIRADRGIWLPLPMTVTAQGHYQGEIPGVPAGTIIQFYVEAVDGLGTPSVYPAAGPESFAQYASRGQMPRDTGVHNYRIIMRQDQQERLYASTHLMSNERLGATLIVNEQDVYYNVGVRLKSSEHGRPKPNRVGYSVTFNEDRLFRGVHGKIAFDRSDGQNTGQREMLLHAAMNRLGGLTKYHDLGYLMPPDPRHRSGVEVQLARFDSLYTEECYGPIGGSGTLYEYELVYPLTATVGNDPEGLKIAQEGGGVQGLSVDTYLGPDKEKYRWHFLIKNNRSLDNYDPIVRMTQILSSSGATFSEGIENALDVDQWMQAFAVGSCWGIGDNWLSNSSHNALFYHRPTDDKILFFLHDLDYVYNVSARLKRNDILSRITGDPHWDHAFYGKVFDFLKTSFNREYMSHWANHFAALLPEQNWDAWLDYIDDRHRNILQQIQQNVPGEIPFAVLPSVAVMDDHHAAWVRGEGWIDVHSIEVRETGTALAVTWESLTQWHASLPADRGPGVYTLEAYDSQGAWLGSDTVTLSAAPGGNR